MANYRENIVDIELEARQLHRSFVSITLGEGDSNCQVYGVRLFRNGEPEDVEGSVVGYFIRQDGQPVLLDGEKDGNVAKVMLEESCFTVPGNFMLAIKILSASMTNTVRIVDGTILDTVVGTPIDPGGVIPDLSDYEDAADRIEAAADVIEGATFETENISGTRYKLIAALSE